VGLKSNSNIIDMNRIEHEVSLYGKPKNDIIQSIENSQEFKSYGIRVVLSSYLVDIQEMNDHNVYGSYTVSIRQSLNIINMLLSHYDLGRS
jgi:hypothetical protein